MSWRAERSLRRAFGVALFAAAMPCGIARADQPTGRGLIGGAVSGVTSTLDGAITSVSTATGGAVSLPTTGQVTDSVTGTVAVVGSAAGDVVAPVVGNGPQVALAVPGLAEVGGLAVLGLVVGNAGTDPCTPLVTMAVTGADGVQVAGGVTQLGAVLPGSSTQYVLPWPTGLNTGTYDVSTSASACGDTQTVLLSVHVDAQITTPEPSAGGGSGGTSGGGSGGGSAAPGGGTQPSAPGHGHADQPSAATDPSADTGTSLAHAASGAAGVASKPGTTKPTPQRATAGGKRHHPRAPSAGAASSPNPMGPPAPVTRFNGSSVPPVGVSGRVDGAPIGVHRSGARQTLGAVVRAIPSVLERAAPFLAALGLIGALFVLQEGLARRDSKLALAPLGPAEDLPFDEPSALLDRIARGC